MSGHSKWATIKRKKGAADAKRGVAFTRLANTITVAAREGGGDPEMNFTLRLAMDKAKEGNMPSANIERAIKRGTGELGSDKPLEEVSYEAYGPGGVAILVKCLTDNRNRTVSEVRSKVTKRGGNLGEAGSVAYLFSQQGVILLGGQSDADEVLLTAADAGADDVETADDGTVEVTTPRTALRTVKEALETAGFEIASAELADVAGAQVPVSEASVAHSIVNLIEELEELDDVISVATNADIDPSFLE